MAVYVDRPSQHARGNREDNLWCHLMADSLKELHEFAERIQVKRCWFHRDHYDLKPSQRQRALEAGAIEVTARDLVHIRRSF